MLIDSEKLKAMLERLKTTPEKDIVDRVFNGGIITALGCIGILEGYEVAVKKIEKGGVFKCGSQGLAKFKATAKIKIGSKSGK